MSATENTVDITDVPKEGTSVDPKIVDNKTTENVEKLSYLSLFRYSSLGEKIMVIIGLIGAIGQGLSMPLM